MKTTGFHTLLVLLLMSGGWNIQAQNITEIHYHNHPFHVPNSVCQSKDGNILVQCDITQDNEKIGSKLLKFNKQGVCSDSLFIDDEAEVWAFINANPMGEGDIMASLRCEDSVVSVRILHLDEHLAITAQDEGTGCAERNGWGVLLFRIWTADKSSEGIEIVEAIIL